MTRILHIIITLFVFSPLSSHAQNYELTYSYDRKKISEDKQKPSNEIILRQIILTPSGYTSRYGSEEDIYNFDTYIVTNINHKNETYTQSSIYSKFVANNLSLNYYNLMTNLLIENGTNKNNISDEFQLETIYNQLTDNSKQKVIKESVNGVRRTFALKDKDVMDLVLSDKTVPQELKNSVKKLYIYEFQIHPQICGKINNYDKFVSDIRYDTLLFNKPVSINYSLTNIKKTNIKPSIPSNYEKVFSHNKDLNILYDKVIRAGSKPSKAFYESEFKRLINEENYLDAFLVTYEQMLQYDTDSKKEFFDLFKYTHSNQSDMALLLMKQIIDYSKNPKEKAQKLYDFVKSIDRSNLKYGYILDTFLGETVSITKSKADSKDYLINAVNHSPTIIEIYSLLNEAYMTDFENLDNIYNTSKCIEIIKILDPTHPSLEVINSYIERTKEQHPGDY